MPAPAGVVAEDYLKTIYAHTEWQDAPVTTTALAARLGLAPSSVTEMVRKLGASGLVRHEPYGAIELTADGLAVALRIVRRHRLIETWLVEQHGYDWAEVHDEAEVLEHVVSDRLLESIDRTLGHPIVDPHGDPIPTPDGAVTVPPAVGLATAPLGRVRVVQISDRDPSVLRRLASRSIHVGSSLTVVEAADAAGTVVVEGDGGRLALDSPAAAAIRVTS